MKYQPENLFDHIRRRGGIGLTLFNTYQEGHEAEQLIKLVHLRDKAVLRWASKKMSNISPFTYAMLHDGSTIFTILEIKPILDHEVQEIEICL